MPTRPDASPSVSQPAAANALSASPPSDPRNDLIKLLEPDHVLLIDEPISRHDLLRRLVSAAVAGTLMETSGEVLLKRVEERESRGSTFLNEGVALPHARVPGLSAPLAALAVTRAGLLDADAPALDIAFLLLTPADGPNAHLRLLATAGRTFGDRESRHRITAASSIDDVFQLIHRP